MQVRKRGSGLADGGRSRGRGVGKRSVVEVGWSILILTLRSEAMEGVHHIYQAYLLVGLAA